MLEHKSAKLGISTLLLICAGPVLANDFGDYGEESSLYQVVRKIPAANKSANAAGYARLLALNPNKELYWNKFEWYSGSDESELYKIVRRIPASNKKANAAGYARLLAIDPNNNMYKAKFEKYSGQSQAPQPARSASARGTSLDFADYDDESSLYKVVRKIPAADKSANAAGYARLLALNPNKEMYWNKFEWYSGPDESELFKIVRAIPASNRSANAAGYARLLAIDPNNKTYKSKFERYSGQSKGPKSVRSASSLGSFLVGSWCVLDNDPTYVSGPYVNKLVILADGNYMLFSKQIADLAWDEPKERGKLAFDEGRYQDTGKRYFRAVSTQYGSPILIVDASDYSVSWESVMAKLGETSRDSCSTFE